MAAATLVHISLKSGFPSASISCARRSNRSPALRIPRKVAASPQVEGQARSEMVRGALHLMTAIGYNHRYVSRGRAFDRLMKQALTAARQLLQELGRINAPRPDASAQRCCGRWGYPLGKRPSTYAMGAGL